MPFLTILRRIQSSIFELSVRRRQNCIDDVFISVIFAKKKRLMASFRQERLTTTSFTHRNPPFPVNGKMIDRIS